MQDGREDKHANDLFYVCSVIEHTARKTKNKRGELVQKLGETELARLLHLADVLHCEPLETTANDLIQRCNIPNGIFDNIAACKYTVPTCFDIAKVYKRLIISVARDSNLTLIDALQQVYTSWISPKIDDYNSSLYYENPDYLFKSYIAGKPI